MDDNRIEGAVREGLGRAQGAFGESAGDSSLRIKGKLNEVAGTAQNAYGQGVDQARRLLDQAKGRVEDKPYSALAIAGVVGLIAGLLLNTGRGSKIVYVKTPPAK